MENSINYIEGAKPGETQTRLGPMHAWCQPRTLGLSSWAAKTNAN
jgi:hypothetical protein